MWGSWRFHLLFLSFLFFTDDVRTCLLCPCLLAVHNLPRGECWGGGERYKQGVGLVQMVGMDVDRLGGHLRMTKMVVGSKNYIF